MSTTSGNMKSFKVTDKDGNVFVMTPVDTEARQAIDGAKNLEFDDDYFTSDLSQDQSTVSVGLNGVPLGVDSDSPLKFVQDNAQGIVFGSDAPFGTAIAPEYDATATYAVGDHCMHLGKYYECETAISTAEDWDATHWTETDIETAMPKSGKVAVFYVDYNLGQKVYPDPDEILVAINAGKFVVIDEPNQGVWSHVEWLLEYANRGAQDYIKFVYGPNTLIAARDNTAAEPTWQWNTGYLYDDTLSSTSTNAVQNTMLYSIFNGEGSGEGFRELRFSNTDGLQFVKTHPSTKILSEGFPVDSVDYQLVRTFNGFIYKNITGWKVDGTVTVGLWNYDTKQYVAEVALSSTSDQSPDTIATLTYATASDEMELHVKGSGTIGAIMGAI